MAEKKLMVGAAKLSIAPTKDMFPLIQGFDGKGYDANREGEEISVRAIVVDNGKERILFEAFELGGIPSQKRLYQDIGDRFGFPTDHMLFNATHNHSAPFTLDPDRPRFVGRMTEDASDNAARFTERVHSQAVKAVELALHNMRPAKVGFAEDKCYINVNRDEHFDDGFWMQGKNWEGCSDKTVAAMKFVDDNGHVIAAVLNYAVHDIMTFLQYDADGKRKITCGIPGIACNYIEKQFGHDAVVLWQSGAAGNQNPYLMPGRRYDTNRTMYLTTHEDPPGMCYFNAVLMGEQHAIDALRALDKIDRYRENVRIATTESLLYFPGQKFPEDYEEKTGIPEYVHRLMVDNCLVMSGIKKPGEWVDKQLADMIPTDQKVPMKAQLLLLGDVAYFGVGCELYNEIGMLCKAASPFKHTVITTHAGSPAAGYILDDASKGRKVFQSFGLVREGESNDIVVNGMLALFDKVL